MLSCARHGRAEAGHRGGASVESLESAEPRHLELRDLLAVVDHADHARLDDVEGLARLALLDDGPLAEGGLGLGLGSGLGLGLGLELGIGCMGMG